MRLKCLLGLVLTIVTGLFLGNQVFAEDHLIIQITPATQRIEMDPGKSYSGYFILQNTGNIDYSYELAAVPYIINEDNYDNPDFVVEHASTFTQIYKWVSFEEKVGRITVGGRKRINYLIKVPEDVPAGGQYCALMVQAINEDKGEKFVQAVGRVGLLLYAQVSGETREEGEITDVNIRNWYINSPITTSYTAKNTGNIDYTAGVKLEISNFITGKKVYENNEKNDERVVLPVSSRYNTLTWDNTPKLGIFKVKMTVSVLDEVKTVEKIVFVSPLWFLLLVAFLFALAIVLIVIKHKSRKKEFID